MESHTNEIEKMVNHPQHYGGENNPYEVIKVIEALEMDFHIGNTFKYIARAGKKETDKELQDLKKAFGIHNVRLNSLRANVNLFVTWYGVYLYGRIDARIRN